jgi:hypothetical protein
VTGRKPHAERLAHALLFEGYVLYPYRRSSLENIDAHPARDRGVQGMPGHRFFFAADELGRAA